jgi:hypothetical protein
VNAPAVMKSITSDPLVLFQVPHHLRTHVSQYFAFDQEPQALQPVTAGLARNPCCFSTTVT